MSITTVAGLASLLTLCRKFIRIYLRHKPRLLDQINPQERAALEAIAAAIDDLLGQEPIPDE